MERFALHNYAQISPIFIFSPEIRLNLDFEKIKSGAMFAYYAFARGQT